MSDQRIVTRARQQQPDWALIQYRGILHLLNLRAMRLQLLRRQIGGRGVDSIRELARSIGCAPSTMSRLFAGRHASLDTLVRVLAALELKFDKVCMALDAEDLRRLFDKGTVERDGVVITLDPLAIVGAAKARALALPPPPGAARMKGPRGDRLHD
jgi:transcriptional regulator with XRE-family HTH domain